MYAWIDDAIKERSPLQSMLFAHVLVEEARQKAQERPMSASHYFRPR